MISGTQARAEWRALISAAFIGSGLGLSLGAVYLAGGMGRAVADHSRAERIALATGGGFAEAALRGPLAMDPSLAAIAQAHDPQGAGGAAEALQAAAKTSRARELDCLAQAVYFEARGESARGQAAVATVIINRVKNPNFPKTVCGVVYQGADHRNGCQFSFACDGAAERVVELTAWSRARQVAARVLSGAVMRDVGSATHFHTTAVDPDWGSRMFRVAQVGLHVFYRFNPHAPKPALRDEADDEAVFASAPAAADTTLRLAAALVAPAAADAPPSAPAVTPDAKPAPVKLPELPPAGGLAKTDAPTSAKAPEAAAS